MKNIILLLLCLFYCIDSINYRYLFYQKHQLYNKYISIKEENIKYSGLFTYDVDKNNVCVNYKYIYIKKKNDYYNKYRILIHELTHYLQCIYSIKHNKPFSSITNNLPNNQTIEFIKTTYNESVYKEEFEAFYYQNNPDLFPQLEKYVLY